MTKSEYMNQLKQELTGLPVAEIDEIIRDQEEYITEAVRAGRSESEVLQSLGSVQEFSKELKVNHQIKLAAGETRFVSKLDKVLKAIFAICVLAPFNLIVVLGPFLALCGVLIVVWSLAISATLVGLSGVGVSFLTIAKGLFIFLTILFGSLTVIGFSLLCLVGCYYLTIGFLKGTLHYLKWNFEFITGEKV